MSNQPERIIDESPVGMPRDTKELTTADIAGAAAVAPAESSFRSEPISEHQQQTVPSDESFEPLFKEDEADVFRARWYSDQAGFVDVPRRSVAEADELVASVMKRLAEVFAAERQNLEHEWSGGEEVSTEDLRMALRRYRSFFDRLLSV